MVIGAGACESVTSSGPILVRKIEISLGKLMKFIKVFLNSAMIYTETLSTSNNFTDGQASQNKAILGVQSYVIFTIGLNTSTLACHTPLQNDPGSPYHLTCPCGAPV